MPFPSVPSTVEGRAIVRHHIDVGKTITIREADYLYGRGDLTLEITAIPQNHPHAEWIKVIGRQVLHGGALGPLREVIIRVTARPRT